MLFLKTRLYGYLEKIFDIIIGGVNEYNYDEMNLVNYFFEDDLFKNSVYHKYTSEMLNYFKNGEDKKYKSLEILNVALCGNSEDRLSFCGFIINLKLPHDLKERIIFNRSFNYSDKNYKIENILIFKSDSLITFSDNILHSNDENENILNFIENILLKNSVNLIFAVGYAFDKKTKDILNSYNIMYFEWIDWKNYQVT